MDKTAWPYANIIHVKHSTKLSNEYNRIQLCFLTCARLEANLSK